MRFLCPFKSSCGIARISLRLADFPASFPLIEKEWSQPHELIVMFVFASVHTSKTGYV
jgi:hypothetical protein